MYHTTGFAKDEIIDLCALVYANEENCDIDPWPPSLGLYKSVVIALTYMRRNRVQQELAETYDLPYTTGSLPAQYLKSWRTILKLALPNKFLEATADDARRGLSTALRDRPGA